MSTIYDLKPAFQNLLRPLVNTMAKKGITPNQITWAALCLSAVTGIAIGLSDGAVWILLMIPVIMFIRMALNALDGILAKEHNMTSERGAVLNEMGDVASDAVLYLPFALIPGVNSIAIVLFVVVGILSEMAGVLGASIGHQRRYDGPMGKSDRAFVVGTLSLLWGFDVEPGIWSDTVISIAILLGIITVIRRSKGAVS